MRNAQVTIILVLLNALGCQSLAQSVAETGQDAASQPIASTQTTVTEAERERIESLVASLRWSGTIGSGHGPLFQIQGNDSAEELTRIGTPAVPFLLQALSPVEEVNPLAKRRNVAAVTILGAIGDPSAMEGIVAAMHEQWKDALFLQAATSALGKIKDDRGIPALEEVGRLSLRVFEATLSSERKPLIGAEAQLASKLQWWTANEHISDVNMAILWTKAFAAIAEISPSRAVEIARSMNRDGDEFSCLGASVLACAAAKNDAKHVNEAKSICHTAIACAKRREVKEWLDGLLGELKPPAETPGAGKRVTTD